MIPSWYRGLCCFGAASDINWSGALVGCLVRTFLVHHEDLEGPHFVVSTHQIRPTQRSVMMSVMGKTLWERFHVVKLCRGSALAEGDIRRRLRAPPRGRSRTMLIGWCLSFSFRCYENGTGEGLLAHSGLVSLS